jgi:NADH-quinone oxidoreductase subunit C
MSDAVSPAKTLMGKEAVLAEMSAHPAVKAILDWNPAALADAKFDFAELTLTIVSEEICGAATALQKAGYNFFEDLTAVDWYPTSPRFQLSYHLLSIPMKERVRLRVMIEEAIPTIDSITSLWPSANYYEREVFDLFGIRFEDHPNMRRILMPDDWKGHPLRKDYPVEGYR